MRLNKKYEYKQKKFWQYGNIYAKIFFIAGMIAPLIVLLIKNLRK